MFYYSVSSKSMLIFQISIAKEAGNKIKKFVEYKSSLNKWKTKLNQLDNEIKLYFIFIVLKGAFKDTKIEDCYNIVYLDELDDFSDIKEIVSNLNKKFNE